MNGARDCHIFNHNRKCGQCKTWSVGSTTGTLKIDPRSRESLWLTSQVLSIFESVSMSEFDEYEIHSEPLSPSTCVGFSLALQPQHLVRWKGRYYYYRLSTACLVKSAPQTDTERGEPRPTTQWGPWRRSQEYIWYQARCRECFLFVKKNILRRMWHLKPPLISLAATHN